MTNQDAIKYVKTCIDNLRQYEGNEQFIEAIDIVIAMAENKKDWIDRAVIWVDENVGTLTAIALRKHLEE